MKTIDEKILELIMDLSGEYKILKYVYNNNIDFIAGVTPIYYSGPYWTNAEIIAAIKSLLVGSWLASGESVIKFENELCRKINTKHSFMCNSGSSANLLMFSALKKCFNWNDNDEIICSVVGFPTTTSPIIQTNLKPVFVDIELDSLNIQMRDIESKITDKTRAIILSPVLGNTPCIDYIVDLCEKHDILFLLDNCDSLGSKWKGKYLNEYSYASTLSFYASHHLSCGHGGMVMSYDKSFIKVVRSMATWGRGCYCSGVSNLLQDGKCGKRFDSWLAPKEESIIDHKYVFENIGYNLAPLDLQGAIGLEQLKKFDEIHSNRKNSYDKISTILRENLSNILYVPEELEDAETSWFGVPIVVHDSAIKNKLVQYFEDKKIQTRHYFAGNLLVQPAFESYGNYLDYPNANKVLSNVFFIGAAPHYDERVFDYIEKTVKDFK